MNPPTPKRAKMGQGEGASVSINEGMPVVESLRESMEVSDEESEKESELDFRTSDFGDVVIVYVFVEKTMLIKAILEGTDKILITALSRFGKSTNMNMLKKFVEIQVDEKGKPIDEQFSSNYKIFKDLQIFRNIDFLKKHFNQWPVIYVNFTGRR